MLDAIASAVTSSIEVERWSEGCGENNGGLVCSSGRSCEPGDVR
jgi:hypothetical protein